LMLRAMIQAAQADGQVDRDEIDRILDRLREHGEEAEAQAFVEAELMRAPDPEALAREVRSPEQGARLYAASLLAIEVDTPGERGHLARLATALRLPRAAVDRIHQGLGVAG
ncbi:MAG: tellurite resistance TerB family protein, partial [Acetobacteraceae bacterium]|nr:tellurite resistance TerB family protein [Acetobacteraceae bacterium]